jgi:type IV secretory pathway VirB10-like protein
MKKSPLTYKAPIRGLSRTKIILALCVLLLITLVATFWGVFSNNDNETTIVASDLTNTQYPATKDNNATLNLINKLNNLTSRNNTIVVPTKNNALSLNASVVNSKTKLDEAGMEEVPPIVNDNKKNGINQNHQLTQPSLNTIVYSAKTLIYSKYQALPTNTTAPVDNVKNNINNSVSNPTSYKNNSTTLNSSNSINSSSPTTPKATTINNLQSDKSLNNNYLQTQIQTPISAYELNAGSIIPATMITGLNSDLPGQVIAIVRQNVYDSVSRRYLLIPQGARLIGLYDSNIAYGQKRVLVAWNRLIYPNGNSINLHAMPGTDLEGYAGLHDKVDNKYWQIFGTSFIMGVITGAMQYSQNNTNANVQVGGIGYTNTNPTIGQTLAGSLGQQLGQTGLAITQKNLNVQPTLIIRPGYPFNVMLTADMVLQPYLTTPN